MITSTFSWRFTISIARFFLKISLRSRDTSWERFDSLANTQLPLWDKYSTLEHFRSQEIFFWSDGQKRFESSVLKSKVHLELINENCQKWTKLSQQTCLTLSLLSHDGKPHLISPQHFSEDSKAWNWLWGPIWIKSNWYRVRSLFMGKWRIAHSICSMIYYVV